jgi:WD40 repeat protein
VISRSRVHRFGEPGIAPTITDKGHRRANLSLLAGRRACAHYAREEMLAVGTVAGRIHLVDAETGNLRWKVQGLNNNCHLLFVAMSPDGRFVASVGGRSECWKLWDAASGVEWMAGARHDGTGACKCRVTSMGRKLDAGCPVRAHTRGLRAVAFSPCGQRLATGGDGHAVILWDAQTGNGEHVMKTHSSRISSVSFSADGLRLATWSDDGSICVWDATIGGNATGALLRTIRDNAHRYDVKCVHFSPRDNNMLASVGYPRGSVLQWDVASGEKIRTIDGFTLATFSPDGRTIATLSNPFGSDVHLIDANTGIMQLRVVCSQGTTIYTISYSVDGSKLLTGGSDGSCKEWDSSTGALLRTIEFAHCAQSVSWGRDWVLDEKCVSFAMGQHPRLGAGSLVLELEVGVVRMILDRV